MELKRIIGPDVKTALRLVREQLGPDAMILSNRRVAGGVEIVAAPELAAQETQRAAQAAAATRRQAPYGHAALAPLGHEPPAPPAAHAVPASPAQLLEVQSELRSMRAFLEARLAEMQSERAAFGPGVEGRMWRRLTRMGLPNALVRELVASTDAEHGWSVAWAEVLSRLAAGLREGGDPVAARGRWAFVGPTGAGKSTTICKLAVRHVLAHGAGDLALLSMDGARLGGTDMLRAVARLLGVPFHAASAGESLEDMLGRAGERGLVLIDTAGVNRRPGGASGAIEALGALRERVGTLLVLPANAQLSCLEAALADHAACAPAGAVVTKLDETASLGEVIGILARERLPLAYTSDGQEIPDDLHVARASGLVARAVALDPEGGSGLEDARAALAPAGAAPAAGAAPGGNAARIA